MKKQALREKIDFENIRDVVEWAAETYGERPAFSWRPIPHKEETEVRSYLDLRDDVRALVTEMQYREMHGKHCAVIGKCSYEFIVTYYASLCSGTIFVPLDKDWTAEELAATCVRAEISFLIVDEDCKEKAAVINEALGGKTPILYLCAKTEEDSIASLLCEGRLKYDAFPETYHKAEQNVDDLALLVFTSGTTGKGKGVMLSQRCVLSCITDVIPYMDFGRKTVGVLPPHHTYGSTIMFLGHVLIGCEVYISSGLRYVAKELKEQKPEHLVAVPLYLETFYRRIMATVKEQGKEDLVRKMIKLSNGVRRVGIDVRKKLFGSIRAAFGGEIKMIISGGAPINPEILQFFEAIGISTLNGYGITECAPLISVNRSRNVVPGSVGNVLEIDEIRIDEPNEDGEGEICVKGPNVMLGYYKDPDATADAIDVDGFFHTGDYGRQDKDGVLYITGRKKNLIILSNGKNVYPEEIENALIATPGILDIVVYEGQSRRGMEHNAIVAEIYPDKDYIEKNGVTDIYAHLRPYIEAYNQTAVAYKKIGVYKVRTEEFPKNTLRKIMRFQIDMTID